MGGQRRKAQAKLVGVGPLCTRTGPAKGRGPGGSRSINTTSAQVLFTPFPPLVGWELC